MPNCLRIKETHESLQSLRGAYAEALAHAPESGDWFEVKKLKAQITSRVELLKQEIRPFQFMTLEIGGKTKEQLIREIEASGMNLSDAARQMMDHADFSTNKTKERMDFVSLTVKDLGFSGNATTDQIFKRAEKLGLELCPPEVGPHYRLQYIDQPMDHLARIGMKQITDFDASPRVFRVGHNADGTWLDSDWAFSTGKWSPVRPFLFRLRTPTTSPT